MADSFSIHSEILNEERQIYVYLPQGHDETGEVYPVIYLLDGHRLFNVTSSFVEYYSKSSRIPPMIVVGIASTDRRRDFTPTVREGDGRRPSGGGGADNFLNFMAKELFPRIESKYPTRDYRILIGHSLGGLFTVHALISQPSPFRAYMALSPWFGPGDDALLAKIKSFLKERASPTKLLFTAHEPINRDDTEERINTFIDMLQEHRQEELEWEYKLYEDADHMNLPLKAIPHGLDFFFPGIVQDR